jgi:hypothetical protein
MLFPFYILLIASRFVDRDMLMRFRGGGVGHKSTRSTTDQFLMDRDTLDKEYAAGQQEKDESLEECEVDGPSDDDSKPNEPDGDVESTDSDSYGSDEEYDYGYARRVSDDESEEELIYCRWGTSGAGTIVEFLCTSAPYIYDVSDLRLISKRYSIPCVRGKSGTKD